MGPNGFQSNCRARTRCRRLTSSPVEPRLIVEGIVVAFRVQGWKIRVSGFRVHTVGFSILEEKPGKTQSDCLCFDQSRTQMTERPASSGPAEISAPEIAVMNFSSSWLAKLIKGGLTNVELQKIARPPRDGAAVVPQRLRPYQMHGTCSFSTRYEGRNRTFRYSIDLEGGLGAIFS
jgi:hypothetical protein